MWVVALGTVVLKRQRDNIVISQLKLKQEQTFIQNGRSLYNTKAFAPRQIKIM